MNLKNRHRIADMAKVNTGETEYFPEGQFRLDVYGKEGNKAAHFHVANPQEGFEVKVTTENPKILKVVRAGKRRNDAEAFGDVIKAAKLWLPKTPADPRISAKFASNKEYIEFQYQVFNPK